MHLGPIKEMPEQWRQSGCDAEVPSNSVTVEKGGNGI